MVSYKQLALILVLASVAVARSTKEDPTECEVCIKVLTDIRQSAATELEGVKTSEARIGVLQDSINSFCGDLNSADNKLGKKEKKMCYYLQPINKDVATRLNLCGKDPKDYLRACRKLSKSNDEICQVKFPVKRGKDTDYSKMRVKQLKAILAERGVSCTGCLEKADYVKRIKETEHMDL